MDALLARVEPAPWGAVVADPRFPLIWDANHARIDRWPRGCTLADVIDCQVWLADARDFVRFNEIYQEYFVHDPPVRSVFPIAFMFPCKVEMKVIAWRPVGEG